MLTWLFMFLKGYLDERSLFWLNSIFTFFLFAVSYPYEGQEPFIIDTCPDVIFAGNQDSFGTTVKGICLVAAFLGQLQIYIPISLLVWDFLYSLCICVTWAILSLPFLIFVSLIKLYEHQHISRFHARSLMGERKEKKIMFALKPVFLFFYLFFYIFQM